MKVTKRIGAVFLTITGQHLRAAVSMVSGNSRFLADICRVACHQSRALGR